LAGQGDAGDPARIPARSNNLEEAKSATPLDFPMELKRSMPGLNQLKKIVGIGPVGAVISLLLLAVFVWADAMLKLSITVAHAGFIKTIGIMLIISGVGLHIWSFFALRSWWRDDRLCTGGAFKYFRHPMYAAWISFIAPGFALYLNSWVYLTWAVFLHVLWHQLVKREEQIMVDTFGDAYKDYARRTGRFFPRMR
jgi:protein-S-isoprenylcysteine O-methyltransferase Ste14